VWTLLCRLLSPINMLGTNLPELPENRANSPEAANTHLAPQFSSSLVLRNRVSPRVEEVRVDMADMKVESRPVALVTNVGSCVAICIYDRVNKCGGLAHIMLPSSTVARNKSLPSKYADTAVPALSEAIKKMGKSSVGLTAKIAGGANMFPSLKSDVLNVGSKNVEAVKNALSAKGIRLLAEDVKGTCGRRVTFNVVDGSVFVKNGNGKVKKI
jgi:chemotaxis protein CheD